MIIYSNSSEQETLVYRSNSPLKIGDFMQAKKLDLKFDPEALDTTLLNKYLLSYGVDPNKANLQDGRCKWYRFSLNQGSVIMAVYAAEDNNKFEQYIMIEHAIGYFESEAELNQAIIKLTADLLNEPYPIKVCWTEGQTSGHYHLLLSYRNKLALTTEDQIEYLLNYFSLYSPVAEIRH